MLTCIKKYDGLEFTHRVFLRDGNPSHIHGHVWGFEFEFEANQPNRNGFVVDFNSFQTLENKLKELKDTVVVSEFDPAVKQLQNLPELFRVTVVPDASSEGLAHHFFTIANRLCDVEIERVVSCIRCTVKESDSNYVTFKSYDYSK
jgi:6-pyruvoyltetrahydropterin/6-carboxytetrahydropterin synthase